LVQSCSPVRCSQGLETDATARDHRAAPTLFWLTKTPVTLSKVAATALHKVTQQWIRVLLSHLNCRSISPYHGASPCRPLPPAGPVRSALAWRPALSSSTSRQPRLFTLRIAAPLIRTQPSRTGGMTALVQARPSVSTISGKPRAALSVACCRTTLRQPGRVHPPVRERFVVRAAEAEGSAPTSEAEEVCFKTHALAAAGRHRMKLLVISQVFASHKQASGHPNLCSSRVIASPAVSLRGCL